MAAKVDGPLTIDHGRVRRAALAKPEWDAPEHLIALRQAPECLAVDRMKPISQFRIGGVPCVGRGHRTHQGTYRAGNAFTIRPPIYSVQPADPTVLQSVAQVGSDHATRYPSERTSATLAAAAREGPPTAPGLFRRASLTAFSGRC